jgi:putative transcriptional regulator
MNSLQGKLLIASPRMADPNFRRSVILMLQHDENSALGVVLNRPLELTVKQACEQLETPCSVEGVLHQGGPCEGPLLVVHTWQEEGDNEILPGLFFTTQREKVERLLEMEEDLAMKFLVGYSGWGPGQLEEELEEGAWLIANPDPETIFGENDEVWTKLKNLITMDGWIDPKRIPPDPSVN